MKTPDSKKLIFGLSILLVVGSIAAGYIWLSWGLLQIRIAFAEDQTKIFDEMREKAVSFDSTAAVTYLKYIINYYPSGSKQESGSKLDKIVERERQSAVREILAYLRQITGQDFGEDPQRWIESLQEAEQTANLETINGI